MITKDIAAYANKNWAFYRKSAAELSKNNKGKPLVDDKTLMYCFDKITDSLFSKDCKPASADALHMQKNGVVLLIEFKRGFDISAPRDSKERDILNKSLQIKALESYLTLEKKIFPLCNDFADRKERRLKYWVVVDTGPTNDTQTMLANISGKGESRQNPLKSIEQALRRFRNQRDATGQSYLYDEIKAISYREFSRYLKPGT